MTLFIGVPCYGSQLYCQFAQCLVRLTSLLTELKIKHTIEFLGSDSLISRARNTIVAKFYSDINYSHLLFLDSDLMFAPEAVVEMLQADVELIGCPYPKKIYNWTKVSNVLASTSINEDHKPLLTDINYNFLPTEQKVESSIIKCKDIPTGFMLMRRSLLSTMMLAYPERKYQNNIAGIDGRASDYFFDFFGTGVVNNYYLSEDYYFCYLVRKLGIDCHLETKYTFGHIGKEIFYGNLGLQLQYFKNDDMNMDRQLIKKQQIADK